MSLLFFNPWNDLALASGDAHYTPPASAMQMAQDLRDLPQLWAPHDLRRLSVWGWSPLLVTQLREKGVDEALLPSAEQMAAYRAASSRQTAVRLLARWRERFPEAFGNGVLVGESKMCMTLQEVLAAVTAYGNEAMLKAPWSGSGRGVHPVHGGVSDKNLAWVTRTLQRQGAVEVEPSYNKVVDGERDYVLMKLMGMFKGLRFEDLEEVYDDGCLVLWEKMMDREFELKEKSLVGYLVRICRNVGMHYLRKVNEDIESLDRILERGYEVKENDENGMRAMFDLMEEKGNEDEIFEKLDMVWEKLKKVDRMILESYYVDGCRMEEIARRIGYRNGNSVKSKKNKVLRKMMEMMREGEDFKDLPNAA